MTYNNQILLGRITKISGYEGFVSVRLERTFIENISELESVFIVIEGKPVPFIISSFEYPGGDTLKIRFSGYEKDTKVAEFNGCEVFLTTLGENTQQTDLPGSFIGYEVLTGDKEHLGIISDIIQNPAQYLISVITPDKKEILIPLHGDLIKKINKRGRKIILELPEGLIDINK